MPAVTFNLRAIADNIRGIMDAPDLDVDQAITSGQIAAFSAGHAPGFTPILSADPDIAIAISSALRFRYLDYREELAVLKKYRADGGANFHEILSILRDRTAAEALSDHKVARLDRPRIHGHECIPHPYMGRHIILRRDMAAQFHHFFLQRILSQHHTGNLDAVFDAGCGRGDLLAELAARFSDPRIQYFGGEIARNGQACLRNFAELLERKNIHSVDFDISAPDFTFLTGLTNVLVISHFALVYAKPFQPAFWRKLFAAAENVRVVLFEPISFALPHLTDTPLFTRSRAQSYDIAENFFDVIRDLEQAGELRITEVIPDATGLTAFNPVSMLCFEKAA